jgi:Flp pilus assembly pilin Flp
MKRLLVDLFRSDDAAIAIECGVLLALIGIAAIAAIAALGNGVQGMFDSHGGEMPTAPGGS